MFFDNLDQIPQLAEHSGCSIFVVPPETALQLKNTQFLRPEDKSTITVEQVRNLLATTFTKQSTPHFIIIQPADALGESAANSLLKSLEEPKENYHFILLTDQLSRILPTILSRSAIYVHRSSCNLDSPVTAKEQDKILAKRLISASSRNLPEIAETIAKHKDNPRRYALNILSIAIEMLYKTYFLNFDPRFLKKLPNLLEAYQNIAQNGHIKLHLVADLL